jgi:hypothetical protein
MSTDLVPVSFAAPAVASAAVDEDLDGLAPSLDYIKFSGTTFSVPGDDPDNPDIVRELVCVIADQHASSVLWMADGDERPAARSDDGRNQIIDPEYDFNAVSGSLGTPKVDTKLCPYHQWGSDPKGGRGKWATDQRRLYVMLEGHPFPMVLTLPPSGIRPFTDYLQKRVLPKGLGLADIATSITLTEIKKGSMKWSEPVFRMLGVLPDETRQGMRQIRAELQHRRGYVAPGSPSAAAEAVAPTRSTISVTRSVRRRRAISLRLRWSDGHRCAWYRAPGRPARTDRGAEGVPRETRVPPGRRHRGSADGARDPDACRCVRV